MVDNEVPERFMGKNLHDVQMLLAQEQKILLAVHRDGKDYLDPHFTLKSSDRLVSIEII